MKVLITGASGFIGSHLARLLTDREHDVYGVVRPGGDLWRIADLRSSGVLRLVECDLRESERLVAFLDGAPPELCIHLAWNPTPGNDLNGHGNLESLTSSIALLDVLAKIGCPRLVIAGTCTEYDTDLGYLSEDSPTKPRTLYAAAKLALQLVASRYAQLGGFESVWLRFFYLYGPYEERRRLVPSVILSLLRGDPASLTKGDQVKDYLHVEDVAAAVWAVATSDLTGVVNVGSGRPVSVRDVATRIAEHIGRPDLLRFGSLPYAEHDPMFVCANNARLTSQTAWKPRVELDDGLAQTIDWWRAQTAAERMSGSPTRSG
jgi:nucleoside-diphosphate-sugar epimerase